MDKFPKHYKKPKLLDVTKASVAGWTADCNPIGNSASSGNPPCSSGQGAPISGGDASFIPPEVLQQGL